MATVSGWSGSTVLAMVMLTACTGHHTDAEQERRKMRADLCMMSDRAATSRDEQQAAKDRAPIEKAQTPSEMLLEAAQFGDVESVRVLLPRIADRKTVDAALLLAARSEPLAVVVKGPDVTPRHPRHEPYAEIAELLLDRGANVEAMDENQDTPLLAAAGDGATAVARLLLHRGAEIEAMNSAGETPLIRAACVCPSVDSPDTDDVVRLLLDNGANIEARDKMGETALLAAADWGREWILRILLDRGAQIEASDNHGNTALMIAAKGGALPSADAVHILLASGANIEARNDKGETALMLAKSGAGSERARIVGMLRAAKSKLP